MRSPYIPNYRPRAVPCRDRFDPEYYEYVPRSEREPEDDDTEDRLLWQADDDS